MKDHTVDPKHVYTAPRFVPCVSAWTLHSGGLGLLSRAKGLICGRPAVRPGGEGAGREAGVGVKGQRPSRPVHMDHIRRRGAHEGDS